MTPTVVGCVSSMATFVTYVLHSYCSASILFVKHNVVMDTRRPHADAWPYATGSACGMGI